MLTAAQHAGGHVIIHVLAGPVTPYERVVALYDYTAQGPEELSLAQGDLLIVLEKIDEVS